MEIKISEIKAKLYYTENIDHTLRCLKVLELLTKIPYSFIENNDKALFIYYDKELNAFINTDDKELFDKYEKEQKTWSFDWLCYIIRRADSVTND